MSFLIRDTLAECKDKVKNHQCSDPFFNYQFLSALQEADCLSKQSGWQANYFHHKNNSVVPFYEKNNSQGEFVFDYSWANAYFRYGMQYYPKIVLSVPFTPIEGNRIFCKDNEDGKETLKDFVKYINEGKFSSIHALFVSENQREIFSGENFIERTDCNYKWVNYGYKTFDDYLQKLKSRYRKNILKERNEIKNSNIFFELVENPKNQTWEEFYLFYALTYVRRGQQPYLNLDFFRKLSGTQPLVLFAKKNDEKIAAALFFVSNDTLYGRYWGSKDDIDYLHFETCYYQGIELAIKKNVSFFDPGIQGQHKLKRGFEPVLNKSYHWIKNEEFRKAISNFCKDESKHINQYYLNAKNALPLKNE